ncbi:hypothetical protein [Motiliproteus sp. MSK22-1]|uniref:hypothetical protein n=1 Tax=Motiliproteus sp. MSK22-1 TaxID=1897630 RepID=UPI0009784F49|nr:hypothetical protein [Motiliproteus sp. MSK22-1]OMH38729.1 hypothetical protein BGP75_05945 [Motiliproteus sp. MSK22-1]
MNWVIIVLLLLSIVGSMLWMMPSPKQRVQAMLRQKAVRLGLQVQITRLLFPRALGESLPEERTCTAYRLPRTPAKTRGKKNTIPWHIFKLESHASVGLPSGWSWSKGEGHLNASQLEIIEKIIAELPDDGFSLESTPLAASIYWRENGTPETVDHIYQLLNRMIDENI